LKLGTVDMSAYAGVYHDAGYGTIRFYAPSDTCPEARSVLHEFAEAGIDVSGSSQRLFARWARNGFTHFSLLHKEGNTFIPRAQSLFPQGYGKNTTPFETGTTGAPNSRFEFDFAEDGTVRGFGILGSYGPPTPRERAGGTIQQRADVWFDRLQ
jgi:hypothetical protein